MNGRFGLAFPPTQERDNDYFIDQLIQQDFISDRVISISQADQNEPTSNSSDKKSVLKLGCYDYSGMKNDREGKAVWIKSDDNTHWLFKVINQGDYTIGITNPLYLPSLLFDRHNPEHLYLKIQAEVPYIYVPEQHFNKLKDTFMNELGSQLHCETDILQNNI